MRVKLHKLGNRLSKGPLVDKIDGESVLLELGKPQTVEDRIGYKLLEKYPDFIEQIHKKIAKPKTYKEYKEEKNKMVESLKSKMDEKNGA